MCDLSSYSREHSPMVCAAPAQREHAAGVPDDKAASMAKGMVTARARGLCIDCAAAVREQRSQMRPVSQDQIGASGLDLLLRLAR